MKFMIKNRVKMNLKINKSIKKKIMKDLLFLIMKIKFQQIKINFKNKKNPN